MSSQLPVRRRTSTLALTVALVAAVLGFGATEARASRYTVAQCDPANRGFADAVFERRNGGDYGFEHRCEEDEEANSLQIETITGTPVGHFGRISWSAPGETRIVGLGVEARLRSDAGHEARLSFLDGNGIEVSRIATGAAGPGGFERYERQLSGAGRERFAASLVCAARGGCPASERARTWIRSVRLTVADAAPPTSSMSGALLAPGWHRGTAALAVAAADAGSGVRRIEVSVGGRDVLPSRTFDCAVIAGSAMVTRMRPCAARQRLERSYDTRTAPFVNGVNRITACARDYGSGGAPGCTSRFVAVDNAPPEVAFLTARDPEDPELIRAPATDLHSGLASGSIAYRPLRGGAWRELPTRIVGGELRARVDSASEPRGRYVFRARATDVAGNSAVTARRRDGSAMVVSFPLRERTRLSASIEGQDHATVDYGERPSLEGALRDSAGKTVAGEVIEVVERFDAGSSLEPITHEARTNRRGRLGVRLARGPSRRIVVRYEGSRRYLDSETHPIRLGVRGSARLEVSSKRVRAGRRVVFRGSIGRFGAKLPEPGKLVELQVRGGGFDRYRTVRQAFRTDGRGRWRMRYGFDRFYTQPTRFRFRLKVTPESRWPYFAPSHSRPRGLTVLPR